VQAAATARDIGSGTVLGFSSKRLLWMEAVARPDVGASPA
jgi:hypothetical protein